MRDAAMMMRARLRPYLDVDEPVEFHWKALGIEDAGIDLHFALIEARDPEPRDLVAAALREQDAMTLWMVSNRLAIPEDAFRMA